MEAGILTHLMPHSQIDIFVQVFQADGGTRSACINCRNTSTCRRWHSNARHCYILQHRVPVFYSFARSELYRRQCRRSRCHCWHSCNDGYKDSSAGAYCRRRNSWRVPAWLKPGLCLYRLKPGLLFNVHDGLSA